MTPAWAAAAERVPAESADAVREALSAGGTPLVPTGTGSLLTRGCPPAEGARLLDLSALRGIVEYEPEDMTVTVRAGTPWPDLQAALGERGQWLPVDPFSRGTVGGVLAADRRCPLAGSYGSIRDYCIGVRFVDGLGREARAGGKVVKNVAGYDLMKLLIGSLGELGVVTEATFKVLPKPEAAAGVRVPALSPDAVRTAQIELAPRWFPAGLWRLDRGSGEELAAVFLGPSVRVRAQVEGFATGFARRPDGLEEAEILGILEEQTRWREHGEDLLGWGGALPAFLGDLDLDAFFPRGPWTADLLRGHFWCRLDADAVRISEMRSALLGGEGHLHLEGNRRTQSVWGRDPGPEADVWRRLKDALDPHGRLPRGRLPGGV